MTRRGAFLPLLVAALALLLVLPVHARLTLRAEQLLDVEAEAELELQSLTQVAANSRLEVMGCKDPKFIRYTDTYAERENKAPIKVSPAPCCAAHDACYKICLTARKGCDDAFDGCFKGLCSAFAGGGFNIKMPQLKGECLAVAALHYGSVRRKPGVDAFKSEQQKACTPQQFGVVMGKLAPDLSLT